MTTYFTFENPQPLNAPINNKSYAPPYGMKTSLEEWMKRAMKEANDSPVHRVPCCTEPKPCQTRILWEPQYAGCGNTYITWDQATGGTCQGCEIGAKQDPRIWTADLNPSIFERSKESGAKWAPEPYAHPRARQLHVQYLQSTLYPQTSSNEKRINRIEDSYCYLKRKLGPGGIQYTTF